LEETVFVYDGMGKLVAEYSTATPTQNPTTSYTATDQLDSPRVITDSNGNVTSRRDFMPFGEELTPDGQSRTTNLKYNTGDNIRQKFTGYQKDTETQLDFAGARMYENRHGRFTAIDPLLASGKSANPQTFNRYVYCLNSPLVLTDSEGLQVTHTGKVYTNKEENFFSSEPFNGSHQFEGARYVEAVDKYTYSMNTNGFYPIGLTADINSRADRALADSQVRNQAMFDSPLPSKWVPELVIDPPGWEEASSRRTFGGWRTITINGERDYETYLRQIDEPKAFALAVGTIGGLNPLKATGGPPIFGRTSRTNFGATTNASTALIGVANGSLDRLTARISGLNIGGKKVFSNIEAFGSRAGSTYRGRGPLPTSDLDIMLTPRRPLYTYSSRNQQFIRYRLNQIRTDFESETGFPVNFTYDGQRPNLQGPFIPLRRQ
jgi:RHS repeat-associated protein